MPQQAKLDSPGMFHYVMIRGIEGRRIVDDELDRSYFVRRLGELAVAACAHAS
jgi:hypothetical protein